MVPFVKNDYDVIINNSINEATSVIEQYNSENSKRAYLGDLGYWINWCKDHGVFSHEEIRKEHIITFIMSHVEKHKISTIERRLASLSRFFQIRKIENPCHDKDISILLKKLTEKYGCSKAWGKAITVDILNDMLETCKDDGLIGIRDAAILLFGFSTGGRRRSEISAAVMENLIKDKNNSFIYNLGKSKTNQTGANDPKPILGRAASALINWLESSKIDEGAIFRSISKHGKIGNLLSDIDINRIVKKRCKLAGYDPKKFTAHSLRSGFVTEGGKKGKSVFDIMALTGHKSIGTVMGYYQAGDIMNNSAAYLAG